MTVTSISESRYLQADEDNEGFCLKCKKFTTSSCEPDAREYTCEECDQNTVYGASEALIMGVIDFNGDDDDDDDDDE